MVEVVVAVALGVEGKAHGLKVRRERAGMANSARSTVQDVNAHTSIEVLDEGPIPGEELFLGRQAEDVFHDWVGCWPSERSFRRVRVRLDALELWPPHAPEMYLADGDQAGFELAKELEQRYRAGLGVDPIVICTVICLLDDVEKLAVPDGCHRCVAAHAAGLETLEAYQLLPEED